MKKRISILLIVFALFIISGCSGKQGVKFGMEDKGGKLGKIIENIPADEEIYVQYTQPDKFNADSVEVEIYQEARLISGGSSKTARDKNTVIIPITIPKPGNYELIVLINDEIKYRKEIVVAQ